MRTRLIAMGLLALALQGCGGGDTTKDVATTSAAQAAAQTGFRAAATGGRAPAVILAADGALDAAAEAQRLAGAGIASLTVTAPRSVGALRAALEDLRARDDVDPARIALVADGASTGLAAQLMARDPRLAAAVLGDAPVAAARPLARVRGAQVMLQRATDASAGDTTLADEKLAAAAPVGTLLHAYPSLRDGAAARERVDWLRKQLG